MPNLIQAAREQVGQLTQNAYERAAAAGALPAGAVIAGKVDIPKDVSHGDYASSFAMAGAKALGKPPPGGGPGPSGAHGPGRLFL